MQHAVIGRLASACSALDLALPLGFFVSSSAEWTEWQIRSCDLYTLCSSKKSIKGYSKHMDL